MGSFGCPYQPQPSVHNTANFASFYGITVKLQNLAFFIILRNSKICFPKLSFERVQLGGKTNNFTQNMSITNYHRLYYESLYVILRNTREEQRVEPQSSGTNND